jgi:hypothetical protein
MPDQIVPYVDRAGQAQKVVISEAAQAAGKASQEFTHAFPEFASSKSNPGARGVNNLDATSQHNKNEAERRLRANRPKPATVINLHPWPLTFGASDRFLRGITVPACHPGELYAYVHIRKTALDWEYEENGSLDFQPVLPIQLAAEFMREFGGKDGYGGGVIIYEGEGHPDKMGEVETYDPLGRPLTVQRQGVENDGENDVQVVIDVPIKRKLIDILQEKRVQRNQHYMDRVRKADNDYKRPDGKGKALINDTHLLMAETLHAEGFIPVLPDWKLRTSLEAGLADENCPACGSARKVDAFKCSCGHILDAFEAYQAGAIEWGHASMETMTVEELEEAEAIRVQRHEKTKILNRPMVAAMSSVEGRANKAAESQPAQ